LNKVNCIIGFIILHFLIGNEDLKSQSKFSDEYHFRAQFQNGLLLPEYDFFYVLTEKTIKGVELNISKKTKGKALWEQLYNYPEIGFSTVFSTLGNKDVFGNVFALNPYIRFEIPVKSKFSFGYKIGVGLCYVTKHFDPLNDYQNIAVGSGINIWFNTEFLLNYKLNKRLSLYSGTVFNHLSNANFSEPNIGLNTLVYTFGMNYLFGEQVKKQDNLIEKFTPHNQYAVFLSSGRKHTRRFAEKTYATASLSFEYKRIAAYRFAYGGGADLFYDASIIDEMNRNQIFDTQPSYIFKSGLHLSQELIIGNLSLGLQEGFYMFLKDYLNEYKMYNRGIIRYRLNKHLFLNLAMVSNLIVLDVMEIGIGYYKK